MTGFNRAFITRLFTASGWLDRFGEYGRKATSKTDLSEVTSGASGGFL